MAIYRWRHLSLPLFWLAFSLRLYRLDFQSIWWDEGHSIFVANHPLTQIPTLPAMDVHPPAYFALLHLWIALIGQSEFGLRYLSVIFSLLTIALLWQFARDLASAPSLVPFFVALLAALSPLYITYAQEVRSYAMITFLALGSTFALWKIVHPGTHNGPHYHWLGAYIFLTAACLYTHYFTIFLLLFQNLVWFSWLIYRYFTTQQAGELEEIRGASRAFDTRLGGHNLRQIKRPITLWIVSQVSILLLFAPQLRLALRQVTTYTNPNLTPPDLAYFISRSWQAYTVGLTINPTPAWWAMTAIAGALSFSWLLQFRIYRASPDRGWWLFFLLNWLLLPLVAYFFVLQSQPSFEPRYMMLITPALFLLFGLIIVPQRHARPAFSAYHIISYILLVIPLGSFIFGLNSYYTNETYFKDDSAAVATWLAAETGPNDIVYIDVPHPFHYYAARSNIPAPTNYLFVDIHTAAARLNQEASGRDRLFWVAWRGSDTDPRGVIPFLAEKSGDFVGSHDFRGYQVSWFTLSPPSEDTFSLPNSLSPVNIVFGEVVRLDGLAFGEVARQDEPTWATLHFTLLRDTAVDYRVSLRLRGEQGQIVAQTDRDLLNDRHFFTAAWPLHDPALNQAINVYTLTLAPNTSPGSYNLEAVVYNAEPPYPSEGVTGLSSPDGVSAVLGRVRVMP